MVFWRTPNGIFYDSLLESLIRDLKFWKTFFCFSPQKMQEKVFTVSTHISLRVQCINLQFLYNLSLIHSLEWTSVETLRVAHKKCPEKFEIKKDIISSDYKYNFIKKHVNFIYIIFYLLVFLLVQKHLQDRNFAIKRNFRLVCKIAFYDSSILHYWLWTIVFILTPNLLHFKKISYIYNYYILN